MSTPKTEIVYQALKVDSDTVTGGTVYAAMVADLGHAHRLAAADAGTDASVGVIAVRLPDGRDLVAEHEAQWADVL